MGNGMQTDEQGRPFFLLANGAKSYVSPAAMGVSGDQSGIGQNETGWHSGGQWNQHTGVVDNPFKWGKLLSTVVAGGLGAGALSAAGAFGGLGGGGAASVPVAGGGVAGGGLGTGALAAGATIPGAGAVSGVGGGSVLSGLGSLATKEGFGKLGQIAGSYGKSLASNRGTALAASQAQDQINTQRGSEDRASLGDAWKRLQYASYILNKKQGYHPSVQGLPSFGTDTPFAPSVAAGADGMKAEVMKRLTGGSQLPPLTDARGMSRSSPWEKMLNVAGPALSLYGGM